MSADLEIDLKDAKKPETTGRRKDYRVTTDEVHIQRIERLEKHLNMDRRELWLLMLDKAEISLFGGKQS
ncbi:MAG: hypothetical protein Kapaf2KO_23820 [Candidatus Kapaibacteriales bacterium]